MTELTHAELARSWASGLPRLKDGRGRGSGVAAATTDSALRTQPILITWFPACRLRGMSRPCGYPTGRWLGVSMAELAMVGENRLPKLNTRVRFPSSAPR